MERRLWLKKQVKRSNKRRCRLERLEVKRKDLEQNDARLDNFLKNVRRTIENTTSGVKKKHILRLS